jgi:hypothetical protein
METRYDPTKKTWPGSKKVTGKLIDEVVDVAIDSDGNGILLYAPINGRLSAFRLNGKTGNWGPTVDLYTGGFIVPLLVFGAQGEALAVWRKTSASNIYAQWFR